MHAYFDADSAPLAMFTGVKVRSWPPHAGMTANAYVVDNPELSDLAARFVEQIGFNGVVDLDLRFDRRDGRYKLLDFNPRMGAQFRLFENGSGTDVVRALHLDLTGRPVSEGEQRAGRRYVVGRSALETAALAAEAGAQVRVVARGKGSVAFGAPPWQQPRLRPGSPFGRAWSLWALAYYPQPYRYLPPAARHHLVRRVLGPLGAWWLRARLEGKVQVSEVSRIAHATSTADGRPSLTVRALGGRVQELSADHVVAATGYRVDLAAMDFLGPEVRTRLAVSRGTPRLGAGFSSSVPGLYFTGLPAAASYGPVMRFVCGTEFASPRLVRHLARRHG